MTSIHDHYRILWNRHRQGWRHFPCVDKLWTSLAMRDLKNVEHLIVECEACAMLWTLCFMHRWRFDTENLKELPLENRLAYAEKTREYISIWCSRYLKLSCFLQWSSVSSWCCRSVHSGEAHDGGVDILTRMLTAYNTPANFDCRCKS